MSLRYRPELDGLRAIAVSIVLVHHVLQPHRFGGFVGVDVFFALSGYLITTILLGEIQRTAKLRFGAFYVRRFLRLYPALLTLLVLTFPLYHWISPAGGIAVQAKRSFVAATYTGNLYMTYRHQWLGPLAHTWSLALEEQYYLIWPVVLLLALRIGLRGPRLAGVLSAAAVAASVFTVRDFTFGSSVFPIQSTCVGLLAGSGLAVVLATPSRMRGALTRTGWGVLGAALLTAELVVFSLTSAIPDGWYVLAAVLATLLAIAATTDGTAGALRRVLSVRPLVGLGRISYGVYLWHYPLVLLCARQLDGWSPWARLALVAPVTIVLAALSYTLVEARFLRLKNRIGRGADDPTPAMPAPVAEGTAR